MIPTPKMLLGGGIITKFWDQWQGTWGEHKNTILKKMFVIHTCHILNLAIQMKTSVITFRSRL